VLVHPIGEGVTIVDALVCGEADGSPHVSGERRDP